MGILVLSCIERIVDMTLGWYITCMRNGYISFQIKFLDGNRKRYNFELHVYPVTQAVNQ